MVPTSKRSKKNTKLAKKLYKVSKSLRLTRRKKLTRVKTYLHREASRIRRRKVPSLWAIARPYLRADSAIYTKFNRNRLFKLKSTRPRRLRKSGRPSRATRLLRRLISGPRQAKKRGLLAKKVVLLTALTWSRQPLLLAVVSPAERRMKAKITAALLRRKQRNYKKLTYLFLKSRRTKWLRTARQLQRLRKAARAKGKKTVRGKLVATKKVVQIVLTTRPTTVKSSSNLSTPEGKVASSARTLLKINKKSKTQVNAPLVAKKKQRTLVSLGKRRARTTRWRRLQRVKRAYTTPLPRISRRPRSRRLLRRKAAILRRSHRAALPPRFSRRRRKDRKLKSYAGRLVRLLRRRTAYRKSRKFRRRVSERALARSRKGLLIAASRPVRRHLYYRRLLRTRRLGVAIPQLRGLRPPLPQINILKQRKRTTLIARGWQSELLYNRETDYYRFPLGVPVKRVVRVGKRVVSIVKRGRARLRATVTPSVSRVTRPKRTPFTAANFKKFLTKGKSRVRVIKAKARLTCFIGPLTESQAKAREHLTTTSVKKLLYAFHQNGPAKDKFSRPAAATTLSVKQRKNAIRTPYFTTIRTKLLTITKQLRKLRVRGKTASRVRHIRKVKARLTKAARHLAGYLPQWKSLTKRRLSVTAPRLLSLHEQLFALTTLSNNTSEQRNGLIPRYLRVGQLPRKHLYDPAPRGYQYDGIMFTRKSLRYKRSRVKQKHVLRAKIKRKLRRRSRKKVVAAHRRTYPFTVRSSVHAGRTVTWKKRGTFRCYLHHKLALTRSLFKELARTKQLAARTGVRPSAPFTRQQSKTSLYGRNLLWTLLATITAAQDSTQNPLIARLCTAIRLLSRRNSVFATSAMRLLVFKTAALVATSTNSVKNEQLIALTRRWASAATFHQLKLNKQLPPLQTSALQHRLAAVGPKAARKTHRFKLVHHEKVKRLLPLRKFKVLLNRLLPRKWYSKKLKARCWRQRTATLLNWNRIRRYRRARAFTVCRVSSSLRARTRRGEHYAARRHPFPISNKRRQRSLSLRRGLKVKAVKQRLSVIKTNLYAAHRLQQQRLLGEKRRALGDLRPLAAQIPNKLSLRKVSALLQARLDSARLRARKALLWKAPLRRRPVLATSRNIEKEQWKTFNGARQKELLRYCHQELRHPRRTISTKKTAYLPKLVLPARHWRAVPVKRGGRLLQLQLSKSSVTAVSIKKLRPRGRLSRIGRAAAQPKLFNYRTKPPHLHYKKLRVKRARKYRIRLLRRRISFRKNRFFMRRRATLGYKETLPGKLVPLQGFPPFVNRPLRTRMRRNKPLRRSLRRHLIKIRSRQRKSTRFRRTRTSTGRVLSTLQSRWVRRGYWLRKKTRKQQRAITPKVQLVNQLLQRFEALADLRSYLLLPAHRPVLASPKRRRCKTIRRAVTPIKFFMYAHRRIARLRRLGARSASRINTKSCRFTTLQTAKRRVRVRAPFRLMKRDAAARFWPKCTAGKRYWIVRPIRRRNRLSARAITKGSILLPPRKRRRLRILPKRTGRLNIKTSSPFAKLPPSRKGPIVQKRILARKSSNKASRKGPIVQKPTSTSQDSNKFNQKSRPPAKQLSAKIKTVTVKTNGEKKQPPIKNNAMPAASLRAAPTLPRDFTRKPKELPVKTTPVKSPTPPVNMLFLTLADVVSLPHATSKTHKVNEPKLSADPARKVAQFNKEPGPETVKAYSAIMSGLKAAWTALQYGKDKLTNEQLELDVKIMEALYTKHYGAVDRFNSKALLDTKQYTAKLADNTAASDKNKKK